MGCTAEILTKEEALALPPEKRPICFRVPSKIYHDVWGAVGEASVCWTPTPAPNCVFDSSKAAKAALDLLFSIAAELERGGITYETHPKFFNYEVKT